MKVLVEDLVGQYVWWSAKKHKKNEKAKRAEKRQTMLKKDAQNKGFGGSMKVLVEDLEGQYVWWSAKKHKKIQKAKRAEKHKTTLKKDAPHKGSTRRECGEA